MYRFVALLVGLVFSAQAAACSCEEFGVSSEDARAAKQVFVFRLVGTELLPSLNGEPSFRVRGRIQVIAHVRGRTRSRELEYSIHQCCGIRLETGKEYVGFTDEEGHRFRGTSATVLPIWGSFDRTIADSLEAVLRGKSRIEDAFAYGSDEIHQIRPPPAPCRHSGKATR